MKISNKFAFTLLELSIVLVIISVIAGAGIVAGTAAMNSAQIANTNNRMNALETALMAFRQANNRLPCPADGTLTEASANFGVEAANLGSCIAGVPASDFFVTIGGITMAEGVIPVRTLNLPDDFMYDGWTRKIAYAVWTPMTNINAFLKYGILFNDCGQLTVKDASGNIRTSYGDYVLLSYGPDGHGAYNPLGTKYSSGSVNGNEQINCHCNNAAANTGYTGNYVMMDPTIDPANVLDPFDDIVRYKERWQLQNQYDQNNPGGWLTCINEAPGFRADGTNASDASGSSVAVGDINGDGIPDLIIGAPGFNGSQGAVYVVFGTSAGYPDILTLSSLNGTNGFRINGVAANDLAGASVAAGDVNGDGIPDVIIGAPGANAGKGSTFVLFGVRGTWPATFNLSSLNGINGIRIDGVAATGASGTSVAAGDVNNDGYADVVIGAPAANANAGLVYTIFGASTFARSSYTLDNNGVTGILQTSATGFVINPMTASDKLGSAVACGDTNGDGIADVVAGQSGYSAAKGMASIVMGKGRGTWLFQTLAVDLTGINGWHAFASAGRFGTSVAVGDVNGDGVGDIIIGAPASSPGGHVGAGATYVLFGNNAAKYTDLQIANLNTYNGFELDGVTAGDASGSAVAVGDVNGDGVGDIVIGAPNATAGGNANAGKTYVVFGSTSVPAAEAFQLSTLNGANGFELDGATIGEHSGAAVAAGDINGDGRAEVVTGAPGSGRGGTAGSGSTYIFFGEKQNAWTSPYNLNLL